MASKNKKSAAEKAEKSAKKKALKKAEKTAESTEEIVKKLPAAPAAKTAKADKKALKKAKKAAKAAKEEKAPKEEKAAKADKKSGKAGKKAKKAKPGKADATEKPLPEKSATAAPAEAAPAETAPAKPKKARKPRKPKAAKPVAETVPPSEPVPAEPVPAEAVPAKPKKVRKPRKPKAEKTETADAPAPDAPAETAPAPEKTPKKRGPRGRKNAKKGSEGIVVTRDNDVDKNDRTTAPARGGRRLIFCAPSEVLKIFRKRGTKNLNLFEPEETAPKAASAPAAHKGNRILKELPKAAPRKIGAVSLDELFGYNPFAKNSVSAEEKLIPKKWLKYYKKLVALKASIQQEINEHSQTAFNRDSRESGNEISASYSQHTADIDNEAFTRDAALSLLSSKQQELAEINIAIERMKKGTYGICEITGKPIPAERLRDIPYTRYSIEGKLEAEKQRQAAARRRRANAATDIAAVTDIENDVPIVFSEDDEADSKKNAGNAEPEAEEPQEK